MGRPLKVRDAGDSLIRTTPHELYKLLRKLDKESEAAVGVLVKIMNTSNDEKVKMAAADKLLGYHKDVAESVNRDALQRAIANMRKGGGESPQESGKPIPTFDFDTVQVIEG